MCKSESIALTFFFFFFYLRTNCSSFIMLKAFSCVCKYRLLGESLTGPAHLKWIYIVHDVIKNECDPLVYIIYSYYKRTDLLRISRDECENNHKFNLVLLWFMIFDFTINNNT